MAELNGKKIIFSPRVFTSGGGGGSYEAGTGIDITNDVISLNANTQTEIAKIAGKQDEIPVYVLQYEANETYKTENLAILTAIRSAAVGSYALFVRVGNLYLPAVTINKDTTPYVVAIDVESSSNMVMYMFEGRNSSTYRETVTTIYFGGGTSYSAGTGINISNDTISLDSAAQTSLGKADTALQSISGGTGISVSGNAVSLDSTTQTTLSEVAGKQNAPSQVTTGTNITLADNTEYRLTNVTTLTLTYPSGNFECWLRLTFASSGTINVTLPNTSTYIGSAPTFANGETWEISVKDGIVVAAKVTA